MILQIHHLVELARTWRSVGKKLVLAHGCFDLLHPGHIRHLEAAKELGDFLMVTVTPDIHVAKGNGRPLFKQDLRIECVAALACVDYAAVNAWPTAVRAIHTLKPHIYVKGPDYRGNLTPALVAEKEAVEEHGGRLEFTATLEYHVTDLVERILKE